MDELHIRVVACRKSGHHAVIDWIADCLEAEGRDVTFWNDCCPGRDPSIGFNRGAPGSERGRGLGRDERDVLIYSYEDSSLEQSYRSFAESWVGPAERGVDLFVFRDPFNQAASGLASAGLRKTRQVHDVWRKQVYEALHLATGRNSRERFSLSYNLWLRPEYRDVYRTMLRLGSRSCKPDGGVGSSFDDGTTDYRHRWRRFVDSPEFWSLFEPEDLERARAVSGDETVVQKVEQEEKIFSGEGRRRCRECRNEYTGGPVCPECGSRSIPIRHS